MTRYLLDENLSPETARFLLEELSIDAVHLSSLGLRRLSDEAIIEAAIELDLVIITYDLDFGLAFQNSAQTSLGVVLLRLSDQTVESANLALSRFFATASDTELHRRSLAIIDERRIRVVGRS